MGIERGGSKVNDGGIAREWSVDPLEIPLGPMSRVRAKRFKETLNVLIRDAQVEEGHVFNSKEETKTVHVTQSQGMTSKVVVKVLKRQVLRVEGKKIKEALNMLIQVLEEYRHIWDVFLIRLYALHIKLFTF